MFDDKELPEQFGGNNTPPELNRIDATYWGMFQNGWVPSHNDMQAPSIKQSYERYRATHSSSDMKAAVSRYQQRLNVRAGVALLERVY
ncbi:Uncharacterised protein [Serratia proteamaculans]|nr:Uncharacterised protein [Serratia proteamaculans]CAI1137436.1 Uncharacterised protein [Serratia proteamaculans]